MQIISYKEIATKSFDDALALLASNRDGLSLDEVAKRSIEFGANELIEKRTHWYEIFFRQFKSAFIYLLLAASAVALFQKEYIDAGMIFIFLILNAVLGFFQEYRAEKALCSSNICRPKNSSRRNGKEILISATNVVPGTSFYSMPETCFPVTLFHSRRWRYCR